MQIMQTWSQPFMAGFLIGDHEDEKMMQRRKEDAIIEKEQKTNIVVMCITDMRVNRHEKYP